MKVHVYHYVEGIVSAGGVIERAARAASGRDYAKWLRVWRMRNDGQTYEEIADTERISERTARRIYSKMNDII